MKFTLSAFFAAFVLTATAFCGCETSSSSLPTNQSIVNGPAITINNGSAYTWVMLGGDQKLSQIGVTISDAALQSLGNTDTAFELAMPANTPTMFKGVMLDYAVHDDTPYNHPHIDPHFFLMDMATRMNIKAGLDTTMPMNMQMPDGYMQMGDSAEDMMGTHWMDTWAPEMHGGPFTSSFVYGLSNGMMSFMELMCDKASLEGNKNIIGSIRVPTIPMTSSMSMTFPHGYSIVRNTSAKSTVIRLYDFR